MLKVVNEPLVLKEFVPIFEDVEGQEPNIFLYSACIVQKKYYLRKAVLLYTVVRNIFNNVNDTSVNSLYLSIYIFFIFCIFLCYICTFSAVEAPVTKTNSLSVCV